MERFKSETDQVALLESLGIYDYELLEFARELRTILVPEYMLYAAKIQILKIFPRDEEAWDFLQKHLVGVHHIFLIGCYWGKKWSLSTVCRKIKRMEYENMVAFLSVFDLYGDKMKECLQYEKYRACLFELFKKGMKKGAR